MFSRVPAFVSVLIRPLLAACLLPTCRAAIDQVQLRYLAECPVADSYFDSVYAALQKSGELEVLSDEALDDLIRRLPVVQEQRGVAHGLLLERRGKQEEARKAFTEVAEFHAGAWHLFRLGDEEPLALRLAEFDNTGSLTTLCHRIIADPDAVHRRTTQQWLAQKLESIRTCAVRALVLKILAEFAFQDGKLKAFVGEAETRAAAAPEGKRASQFYAVSLLHRYLYNQAEADKWMRRAAEEKVTEADLWEAIAGSLPVRGARVEEFALLQRALTAPGVRPAVRWNLLTQWAQTDANGVLEWLRGHPDDSDLISDWIGLESAGPNLRADLYSPGKTGFVTAACARFPDNLALKLWRGSLALNDKRTEEAARDFAAVFTAAGTEWKSEAARAGKPAGFAFAEQAVKSVVYYPPLKSPVRGLDLILRLRDAAWKQLLKANSRKSLLERADAAGPDFFVSRDEEICCWLDAGCTLRAWERLEAAVKEGTLELPNILSFRISHSMEQAFARYRVPASWRKRMADVCVTLTLKAAAGKLPGGNTLAYAVANYGGPEAAGRLVDALPAPATGQTAAMQVTPEARAALSKAAGRETGVSGDGKNRPANLRNGQWIPREPWWSRTPIGPSGCGAWFMSFPDPVTARQVAFHHPAEFPPFRWRGRYQGFQEDRSAFMDRPAFNPVEKLDGVTNEQLLRWRISDQNSFARGGRRGLGPREVPDPGRLIDTLLTEAPNDDLRLLKVQIEISRLENDGIRQRAPAPDSATKPVLKILDEITTEEGAWPLVKAFLRARLRTVSGDTGSAGAGKALEIFKSRGYDMDSPGAQNGVPGVFPASDQSLPSLRREGVNPFLPYIATADERARYDDEIADIRMDRLMQAGQQEQQEASKLAVAVLHRQGSWSTGMEVKYSAAEVLIRNGQWPAVLAALEQEMENNPKDRVVPLNLFFIGTRQEFSKPAVPGRGPPWVRYARHLVRNGTATAEVYETLTKWLYKENNSREAGETSYLWMKALPSAGVFNPEPGSLFPALSAAGRSKDFVEACLRWFEAAKANDSPPQIPSIPVSAVLEFTSSLDEAGNRDEGGHLLLALFKTGLLMTPEGRDYKELGALAGRLEILPEGARLLLDGLIPPETVLTPDSIDFSPGTDESGCPPQLFNPQVTSGQKTVIPVVELMALLHSQSLLGELERRIDSAASQQPPTRNPNRSEYLRRLDLLRLISNCVRDPAGTPARIEALAEKSAPLETNLLKSLPGADAAVYYGFLTKQLLKPAPAGEDPGRRSARVSEVVTHGMAAADAKKDVPLIQNILRLQVLENRRAWEEAFKKTPVVGEPRFDAAQFAATIQRMMTSGIADEALTALEKDMPLLDRLAGKVHAADLADASAAMWMEAHASGLTALKDLLFDAGLRWLAMASANPQNAWLIARARAKWVKVCLVAKKWDTAARELAVFESLPPELTSPIRPTAGELRSQLAAGRHEVTDSEFLTWLAPAEDGKLLLCWHRWGLRGPDNQGNPSPVLTWPVERTAATGEGELQVFASRDSNAWSEVSSAKQLPLAGSLEITPANYFRTVRQRGGKSEFGDILPAGKALLPAGPPAGLLKRNGSAWVPVEDTVWIPLAPDERPGAFGWRARLPAGTDNLSALSRKVPVNPVREHVFSGWVRVSGFSGTLTFSMEDSEMGDRNLPGSYPATVEVMDGAWYFLTSGRVDPHYGAARQYGVSARVRVSLSSGGLRDSPVSLSVCDWNLAELPQEPALPCPVRAIGGFPGGVYKLALSPDGGWLAAADGSGQLAWCPASGETTEPLAKLPTGIRQMEIVEGGRSILCLTNQSELVRCSPVDGSSVSIHQFDPDARPFAFSPAGTAVAIQARTGWAILSLKDGSLQNNATLFRRGTDVYQLPIFSDDESQLVFRSEMNRRGAVPGTLGEPVFDVYSVADGSLLFDSAKPGAAIPEIAIHRRDRPPGAPDFGVITTLTGWTIHVSSTGEVTARHTARPSGPLMKWLPWRNFRPAAFALDHESGTLYTGDESGCILRWDLKLAAE